MKKLFQILKISLFATFGLGKLKSTDAAVRKKARSKLVLSVVLAVILLGSFFSYVLMFFDAFAALGIPEAILAIGVGGASVLTLITSIFRTSNVLFAFSDYDQLMSLPIKRGTVVFVRMLIMYVFDLAFCLLAMVPAAVIYGINTDAGALFYVLSIALAFVAPILPGVVGGLLGTLGSLFVSRLKNKRTFTTILYALFFVAYFLFMFNNNFELSEDITQMIIDKLYAFYPVSEWFAKGVCGIDYLGILWFLLVNVGAGIVAYFALSYSFEWLHNIVTFQRTNSSFKFRGVRATSIKKSLEKREFKRYINTPIYIMNTAIGFIIAPVLGIVLLANVGNLAQSAPTDFGMTLKMLALPVALIMTMIIGLSTTTSSSISIEGRYLWLLKSFPISTRDIFGAKLAMNLKLSVVTTIVSDIMFIIALKPSLFDGTLLVILTLVACFFYAVMGLTADLHLPKLVWNTEVEVVKQGIPVLLVNVLASMFLPAIPLLIMFIVPGVSLTLVAACYTALLLIVTVILYRNLMTKNDERFMNLDA